MNKGKLYLLPTPIGDDALHTIPAYAIEHLHQLKYFIVERTRTARRYISATKPPHPIDDITFMELNKHLPQENILEYLEPLTQGYDVGLLSEAGCPGVADPGAIVVDYAHKKGIRVVPVVGPSSILMALMASGMSGQSFTFHGYLPHKENELNRKVQNLESLSSKENQTQIFIEAPYRNNQLLKFLIKKLGPQTQLAIAMNIGLKDELILSIPVNQWKKRSLPDLHKKPTVFLFYSGKLY